MGNFRVVLDATGGHGCQRKSDGVKQDAPIFWCGRQSCPDCITKEFVEKMAKNVSNVKARIIHWPDENGNVVTDSVVDEFVLGTETVDSYTDTKGVEQYYVHHNPIHRLRSKPM